MNFSIVGTGNMAWFLAERLSAAGHHFEGIYGRNILAANEIATQYPTRIYSGYAELPDADNHICFLAIKDDAIAAVAAQLSFSETVLVHTAGSLSMRLLEGAAIHHGVIWPVYSVNKSRHFLHQDIPLITEGNDAHTAALLSGACTSISTHTAAMGEKQRFHLHMAAVFANNFSNHIIALSQQICEEQGLSFDYLKPLVAQTLERIMQSPAKELQTGPAIRRDEATMLKHLAYLEDKPEVAAVYESLSISIRKMYANGDR